MSGNLSEAGTQSRIRRKTYFLQNEAERNCECPGHVCTATKSVPKLLTQEKLEAREGMGTTISMVTLWRQL